MIINIDEFKAFFPDIANDNDYKLNLIIDAANSTIMTELSNYRFKNELFDTTLKLKMDKTIITDLIKPINTIFIFLVNGEDKITEIEYTTQFISGEFYYGDEIYIEYDAGFIEIPQDIKIATLHLAKSFLEKENENITSEKLGNYSYSKKDIIDNMPTLTTKVIKKYLGEDFEFV